MMIITNFCIKTQKRFTLGNHEKLVTESMAVGYTKQKAIHGDAIRPRTQVCLIAICNFTENKKGGKKNETDYYPTGDDAASC